MRIARDYFFEITEYQLRIKHILACKTAQIHVHVCTLFKLGGIDNITIYMYIKLSYDNITDVVFADTFD